MGPLGCSQNKGPCHTHSTQDSLVIRSKATCLRLAYASWLWLEASCPFPPPPYPYLFLRPLPGSLPALCPLSLFPSPSGHISVLGV